MSKEREPQGPVSGAESTASPSSEDAGVDRKGFRDPLGDNAVERLRSYQVITIPPSARRALMSAELPGASPELLYDTLPPNRAVQQVEQAEADDPLELEAPVVPPARKRRLRGVVTIAAASMLAVVIIAWLRRPTQPPAPASTAAATAAPVAVRAGPSPPETARAVERTEAEPRPSAATAAQPTATVPAPAARPIDPARLRKSATAAQVGPTKKPSGTSTPMPPSPQAARPATVPPQSAAEGAPRKGFRLGSR